MIAPNSNNDASLQHLIQVLLDWLNDVLADERIIVRGLEDDLYDGCVLHKLIGEGSVVTPTHTQTGIVTASLHVILLEVLYFI